MKQKTLYGEINNITHTINPPSYYAPLKIFFFSSKISFNSSIKDIVCARIIANNSPKLSYDAIFFKYRKKNVELIFSTITYYWTKSEKGFQILFLYIINKISSN